MTFALCLATLLITAEPIPTGNSRLDLAFDGKPVRLFTYKPANYRAGPLILVFHGVLRNAEEYRDHARGMADRFQAMVIAPHFSEHEFSVEQYQMGGVVVDGKLRPPSSWTGHLIPKIIAEIRKREQQSVPYYFIGHSGGGQFLIRLAAFVPTEAERIVVANAGTLVFPSRDYQFPFGFGNLMAETASDASLKQFLAQPVTLYLGQNDTERDEYLLKTVAADRQGKTRYERNKAGYALAKSLAESKGWPFHWRVVEVPNVGHDHELMFNHELAAAALGIVEKK